MLNTRSGHVKSLMSYCSQSQRVDKGLLVRNSFFLFLPPLLHVKHVLPLFVGSMMFIFFVFFCVVLLCFFTLLVPCCDVHQDFRIKMMFGSSLPPVVCRKAHVLFTLFVSVCAQWCPTHIALYFCFVFLRLVYPMLSVSLDCPFMIAPLVFSNVYCKCPSNQSLHLHPSNFIYDNLSFTKQNTITVKIRNMNQYFVDKKSCIEIRKFGIARAYIACCIYLHNK